jgi:hypothetical protein
VATQPLPVAGRDKRYLSFTQISRNGRIVRFLADSLVWGYLGVIRGEEG